VEGNALQGTCFARHCRFVPQGRVEGDGNPLRKRQRDFPKRILTRLNTILKIKERLDVLQIIILGLATLALSSYGSPITEEQSPKRFQDNKEQWVNEIQLSGTFRLRGKGFASLVTPEGSFWVEEGKFSSGYKLIELDTSQSQPSALIQKGDRQAWIGLRLGMSNPLKREIARQKLERRGGVLGLLYVKGENEPFTGTAFLSYANGSKSEVTPYVDGKINGTEINYYASGSKYGVTPYVNGQKDGKQIWYNEDGSKKEEFVFENGKEISRKKF
jgi:hypothetical protein